MMIDDTPFERGINISMRTDTADGLQSARDEILKNIDVRQLQQVIDKLGTLSTDVSDAPSITLLK